MNKKKSRKLTLSVETLRNLSDPSLEQVAGGLTELPRCNTERCTATHVCSACNPCA